MNKISFLTHHALVLIHIAENPKATLREIAHRTDLTERTVYNIVHDLEAGKYIVKYKDGRRNIYRLNPEVIQGQQLYSGITLAQLLGRPALPRVKGG